MLDRTTEYARLVVDGKRLTGQAERQACERHLRDMADKSNPWIFDAREAERHISVANMLTIGEGQAKPLKTRGFQDFIIGSLFGWRKKRSTQRRYREAYIQMGRQNGKSFIAGEMCNDFASFADYQRGRIFCTATKQAQADIVWDECAAFIESDDGLKELYKIRHYDRTITSLVTGTTVKAIGRDTKSADGFRSILAIIDEYHAHTTNQMYKLMLDGQINVDNALTLAITTPGFNLNAPCYEQYQFAKKVLSGVVKKDSLFVFICEMDDDDDIWNPANWAKANPFYLWKNDTELNQEKIARMAEKAIEAKEKQGADLVNFLTKSLGRWVSFSGSKLLNLDRWKECGTDRTIADMAGGDAYLGIDLSSGGDLTSIALLFPLGGDDCYIWSHSYLPELRLAEHEKSDDAPYGYWSGAGLITLTSGIYGIKTDYRYIIEDLRKLINEYNIRVIGCGYDNHNASAFLADLETVLDCDLTEVKQSARSLNEPTKDFALSVEAGTVSYDKQNSLLSWSAANAILSAPNSFGEIKIDKMKNQQRIDPIDAIIDAWALWLQSKRSRPPSGEEAFDIWLGITGNDKTE